MSTVSATEQQRIAPATIAVDDVVVKAERQQWRRQRRLKTRDIVLSVATPLVLLLLWETAARTGLIDARLFPAPTTIFARAGEMIVSGELWTHASTTIYRFLMGYLIGGVVGTMVGMLMGMSRVINAMFGPLFAALYALPKIAILPLLLLIFGLNDVPRILAVGITVFFVLQINTLGGIQQIDGKTLEAATAYRATGWKRMIYVILPGALPSILTGFRTATGLAVVVVTAVEFVASNEGLGYLIWNSWQLFQAEKMYVALVAVAVLGALAAFAISGAQHLLLPWQNTKASKRAKKVARTPKSKEGNLR